MRQTIGNISYNKAHHIEEDPEKEASRRKIVAEWRRNQIRGKALDHLRRVMTEHGLAQNIGDLFDREGTPPRNVSVASLVRQYRLLKKQEGWLRTLNSEIHARLKELDLVRYLKDNAAVQGRLRERRNERQRIMFEKLAAEDQAASKEEPNTTPDNMIDPNDGEAAMNMPLKLRVAIREAITREIYMKEQRNITNEFKLTDQEILPSRQISTMMKYLFVEFLPEDDNTVPEDEKAQFDLLYKRLMENEALVREIESNTFDLREFIESADMVVRGEPFLLPEAPGK